MLGEDVAGAGAGLSRIAGVDLGGASTRPKESLVGSEKLPPAAVGALSLPLAEGVGELELAVVLMPFGSGAEDLDGVLSAAGRALVDFFGVLIET